MTDIKISGEVSAFAGSAGQRCQSAVDLGREDFQLRALKYPLLRLSIHGLTAQDQRELADLAKDIVGEQDTTTSVNMIVNRKSASPIAIAIARIVESARGSKWLAMLGAVVGAHAALGMSIGSQGDIGLDVLGAIVGAACSENSQFLQQVIGQDVKAFVERDA
jgi:hypothetical protein